MCIPSPFSPYLSSCSCFCTTSSDLYQIIPLSSFLRITQLLLFYATAANRSCMMDATTEASLHTMIHAESSIQSKTITPSFYRVIHPQCSNVEEGNQVLGSEGMKTGLGAQRAVPFVAAEQEETVSDHSSRFGVLSPRKQHLLQFMVHRGVALFNIHR